MEKLYSVCLWLTHPDQENDDCMTGEEFATEAEARACIANLNTHFNMPYFLECAFVELDGPDCHEIIELPGVAEQAQRQARFDEACERSEGRMQAGMLGGVDAYNDYQPI